MSKKVLIPIAHGFEEIEAIVLIDILRRAGVEVNVAGVGKRQLCGAHGIRIKTDSIVADADAAEYDLIVLPGGHKNAMTLAGDEAVQNLIKTLHRSGKTVAALCAAPVALKQAGVLSGEYACYPGYEEQIGPGAQTDAVVENGNVVTSRGPGTAAEFAFRLVERLCGAQRAQELKRGMLFS
ncbi:MAG: DJ-1 family glyoxalase III [Campylobacterales bacterium]